MTGKIPEQLIEQIRSQSDIVDVISDYMQLTKRGRNWFGLCPFHGEQTPSFSVSQDKQIFHCFGCGAGGNAITFIMDMENIPFPDAVVKLAERVGVHIDVTPGVNAHTSKVISPTEQKMREAHEFAVEFYHHLLVNTEEGEPSLQYLLDRGFTRELIDSHKIGWALPAWDNLSILLERKGFNLKDMAECGLIIHKESDNSYFDRFRGRIMFPIRDENGKVIAFSGRIVNKEADEAKYLNSPESPLFHKSQVLYNLDKARASIRKTRRIVLMEGFADVLSANQAGVYNTVGTMGTSLTPQHVQKLKRLVEQITICYDGDNAGIEAAKRAAEMLHAEKLKVEIAVLPDKLDPDDYIKRYGAESFTGQILEKPYAYIAFMMMYSRRNKNFQFENDTLQYIQEVLIHLVGKTSPVERDLYISQLAKETNITKEAIESEYRKLEAEHVKQYKGTEKKAERQLQEVVKVSKSLTATERAERLLLSHMLYNIHVVDKIINSDDPNPFIRDEYKAVFVKLIGFYEEYTASDYQRFLEILDDSELRKIVMEAALVERDPDHGDQEIIDCLKHIKKHRIKIEIDNLIHERNEAEKMFDYKRALDLLAKEVELKRTLSAM
ncbi:DNA primase [Lysinibacillus sp. 54212]|uniref:DNA primase n=1 Tax=Lysinibacillus sp. 54212 TaxID=3119829 RepID=UPI002FC8EC8C